jgi:isopenicillin N synthase-like dioxygenase
MPRLQVLKGEHWVNVEHVNGAIVVNLGHIMEVITIGYMLVFVRIS